jgi:hypothetical protein
MGNAERGYIVPIADLHIGDPLFHEKKFIKMRDWIAETPNVVVPLVGDILNCATKNSKSDIYGEKMNPNDALKYAVELLEPIRDKIIGSVRGNHCIRVYRESGLDIAENLAERLGVPYAPEGILYNIKFDRYPNLRTGKINYTVYTNHGIGGGRTKGSKVNVVHRLSDIVLADLYISAHVHSANGDKDRYFVPDTRAGKITSMTMTYASAGSYLDYGGYAEAGLMKPSKLGTCRIRLSGLRKDLHVSI